MSDIVEALTDIVGVVGVSVGDAIHDDYAHDEALTAVAQRPLAVVRPGSTADVARVVEVAGRAGVSLTARGSGTGLSGACIPLEGGVVVSFECMRDIIEIDLDNHVAVVQPGVTLDQLDQAIRPYGLVYPVFPGESSASVGGTVATNAGGMRAVKYGVTRHQVLGLEAVLGSGEVIRTGGKFVKATTGYDLTQIIVGSEGTLALVTEATVRLYPRPEFATTVLAPFAALSAVTAAVPKIVASGIGPLLLEYIDVISMDAIVRSHGVELGVNAAVKEQTMAYLVVVLEDRNDDRLDENTEELANLLTDLGALEVYVLPSSSGAQLIEAREKAFWTAKAAGANDILDMVVPRASIPAYMAAVADLAEASRSLVVGCGHAGDGNVHLSVFQPDATVRHDLIHDIFAAGMGLGGAISGEHGIGTEKKAYVAELEDPVKLALMRRIKTAFDPLGILNPGTIFDNDEDMP
ncbi:MAG: FAD-binding oxidoreductase [Acidimicrobiia bacterium]